MFRLNNLAPIHTNKSGQTIDQMKNIDGQLTKTMGIKMRVFYLLVAFCAVFAVMTQITQAQENVPPGSYLRSCTNVSTSGDILSASCQKNQHTSWLGTSLTSYSTCRGDIANIDGVLSCVQGSSDPPPGSYQQSCRNVRVSPSVIEAECGRLNGTWQHTSLTSYTTCRGDIANIDGVLSCAQGTSDPPPGSYQQSCRNVQVSPSAIEAECGRLDGSWQHTSLTSYMTCRGDIANMDGVLSCAQGTSDPPRGSYQRSCRNVRVSSSRLEAECGRLNGSWRHTSLIPYTACQGDIWNRDGVLGCNWKPTPKPIPTITPTPKPSPTGVWWYVSCYAQYSTTYWERPLLRACAWNSQGADAQCSYHGARTNAITSQVLGRQRTGETAACAPVLGNYSVVVPNY